MRVPSAFAPALAALLLAGCAATAPPAVPTGPFHLRYDGPRADARLALSEAMNAARFTVAHEDADLGLVQTDSRALLPTEAAAQSRDAASPESADAFATTDPNTARIWFRLAERRDGRTVLAARPLIDVAVHRDLDDSTSALVPLFADVPATHPLARRLMGQLAAAGFDVVPADSEAFASLGLDTEVYDDQP